MSAEIGIKAWQVAEAIIKGCEDRSMSRKSTGSDEARSVPACIQLLVTNHENLYQKDPCSFIFSGQTSKLHNLANN